MTINLLYLPNFQKNIFLEEFCDLQMVQILIKKYFKLIEKIKKRRVYPFLKSKMEIILKIKNLHSNKISKV